MFLAPVIKIQFPGRTNGGTSFSLAEKRSHGETSKTKTRDAYKEQFPYAMLKHPHQEVGYIPRWLI